MIIHLVKTLQMFTSKLPAAVNGQYWIRDADENGKPRNLLEIEAVSGQWMIKSSHLAVLVGTNGEEIKSAILEKDRFLNLRLKSNNERMILVTQSIETGKQKFEKYVIRKNCILQIGRSPDNDIIYPNPYVSVHHARLSYRDGKWEIEDAGSTNGIYVNGRRIEQKELKVGDAVYIMGLQMIIGKQLLAMNNREHLLEIHTDAVIPFQNQKKENHNSLEPAPQYFYRSPRFFQEIEKLCITIDAPPQPEQPYRVPAVLMMGPAITMGMASVGSGVFSVLNAMANNGSIYNIMPTVIMSGSMLLGTILWPILTKKYEKKIRIRKERERQETYFSYLNEITEQLMRASYEQKAILEENLISKEECLNRIINTDSGLWERTPEQKDFLQLRIGKGDFPLAVDIKYPEYKFSIQKDHLLDAMYGLGSEKKMIENVPIGISLLTASKIGIVGERECARALTRNLLLQTIALYSYDEVKLVLWTDQSEQKEWESLFAVPHIWNKERSQRYLATNEEEMKALSVYMEKEILERTQEKEQAQNDIRIPYYLIVSADKKLADKSGAFLKLMECKENSGYSILMLYDEMRHLPKETVSVIEVSDEKGKIYNKTVRTGEAGDFVPEYASVQELEKAAEKVSDIELEITDESYTLPGMVTFLEMFGVGKIYYLNPLQRWKENNPINTLQTPVGVDTGGSLFYLDLHEKYHGPHGLVAGMTGSGKSEFIITYILSLAVNYHPDEVAFLLIDYKGGGLAGAFEDTEKGIHLPHLAGTITNLDGAAIKRSMISIDSELRRRQAIFREAARISDEGTMDIYKYQTLYRNHAVDEPVPHLFIISDEFAELKTQQPEFMKQLISTARIGRSLGVHLILATQKPAGVVDDQIWSNSKFRVCLKVQDRADSMDMIKRADAAEISQTGRFYLQVGFNEYFALGQSAWCGADYVPAERMEKRAGESVQMIDHPGRIIREIKLQQKTAEETKRHTKQLVAIVRYLSELAEQEQIAVRPLWLPPIPEFIYIDALCQKYGIQMKNGNLNPVVGEYDDPANQRQYPLTVNFSEKGNCLIYGSTGSGKMIFLTSMIYALLRSQTPETLHLYLLDFGAETFRIFEQAPQVGDVVYAQEEEKLVNLVRMLNAEIEERKKLLAEYGGELAEYRKNTGKTLANILVVIQNYVGLSEQYENEMEQFYALFRDGTKYGIYFCVTVNSTNEIRYRASQNFSQIFTMQMNDPGDYIVVLGKTGGVLPTGYKGRGLVRLDEVYEFQTAYCFAEEQTEKLKDFCVRLAKETEGRARRIPVLPEKVNARLLGRYMKELGHVPVGIGKIRLDLVTAPLEKEYIYPIASQDTMPALRTAYAIGVICGHMQGAKTEIWDTEHIFPQSEYASVIQENMEEAVVRIFHEVADRNNIYKDAGLDKKVLLPYEKKVIVICGMEKLSAVLSEDGRDKLRVFLEKGSEIYKVHFILADNERYLRKCSTEQWYRQNVHGGTGIWIGDGFADQNLINTFSYSNRYRAEIGSSFGYVLEKGKPVLAKMAMEEIS